MSELIKCEVCLNDVSIDSKRCVHCGAKITHAMRYNQASEGWKTEYWIGIVIGLMIFIWWMSSINWDAFQAIIND